MTRRIEKGIPLPPARSKDVSADCRLLAQAEIGDSILFDGANRQVVLACLYRVGGPGWYATREERSGIRAWKVKEPGRTNYSRFLK